jgi:hypothetical protein
MTLALTISFGVTAVGLVIAACCLASLAIDEREAKP